MNLASGVRKTKLNLKPFGNLIERIIYTRMCVPLEQAKQRYNGFTAFPWERDYYSETSYERTLQDNNHLKGSQIPKKSTVAKIRSH